MEKIFSFQRFIACFCAVSFVFVNIGIVYAQGVSEQHLVSAKKAINAIHATDQFDSFLPTAARDLKNELIGDDPNLATAISEIVDKQALALAKRRSDLEKEIAHVYAKYFTQEQLDAITAFYSSDTGKKFLTEVPSIARDAYSTFDAWRSAIMQDLVKNVKKEMSETLHLENSIMPTTSNSSANPK
ncbi:DUF2059 domain-containing protein [Bartonella quintana]|uniref:DUF2059 domain-containing protein n=3 Tax=Bartonella quintana TaxID=803 RepID=A0A0H3LVV5_BARQU|nr:DUF2059 domain-containing protein [Bartonella quintana]ETS13094.1 hypothetical protein Q651_00037 [Bartonella quintana BQ2-D70]ETS14251.1 hypothetical protein Q650_00881 [Bartonella quintana JK 73rel]ETS15938.1 hypothetical protein Q649_00890 [Bartonella quintana JK 73]ETS17940.1 hypothetical protein Q647_00878 [Bartonella quintana JK 7]ETS18769.1 hypothetical protein Q648_00467 [Bartonella quintana JK 12]